MRFCIRLSSLILSIFLFVIPAFATETDLQTIIDGSQEVLDRTNELLDILTSTPTDYQLDNDNEYIVDSNSPPVVLLAPSPSVLNGDVFLDIPDNPPTNAPYYGQWYISGLSGNQRVIIYTPNNDNGWGVDDNGFLVRLGSSASGQLYLNGSIPNNVQMSAYSYPRYRTGTTGSTYIDLHIVPDASNVNIYSAFPIKDNLLGFTVPDYCMFFVVGLCVVILLTKKR